MGYVNPGIWSPLKRREQWLVEMTGHKKAGPRYIAPVDVMLLDSEAYLPPPLIIRSRFGLSDVLVRPELQLTSHQPLGITYHQWRYSMLFYAFREMFTSISITDFPPPLEIESVFAATDALATDIYYVALSEAKLADDFPLNDTFSFDSPTQEWGAIWRPLLTRTGLYDRFRILMLGLYEVNFTHTETQELSDNFYFEGWETIARLNWTRIDAFDLGDALNFSVDFTPRTIKQFIDALALNELINVGGQILGVVHLAFPDVMIIDEGGAGIVGFSNFFDQHVLDVQTPTALLVRDDLLVAHLWTATANDDLLRGMVGNTSNPELLPPEEIWLAYSAAVEDTLLDSLSTHIDWEWLLSENFALQEIANPILSDIYPIFTPFGMNAIEWHAYYAGATSSLTLSDAMRWDWGAVLISDGAQHDKIAWVPTPQFITTPLSQTDSWDYKLSVVLSDALAPTDDLWYTYTLFVSKLPLMDNMNWMMTVLMADVFNLLADVLYDRHAAFAAADSIVLDDNVILASPTFRVFADNFLLDEWGRLFYAGALYRYWNYQGPPLLPPIQIFDYPLFDDGLLNWDFGVGLVEKFNLEEGLLFTRASTWDNANWDSAIWSVDGGGGLDSQLTQQDRIVYKLENV